jgi:hypothetical protein
MKTLLALLLLPGILLICLVGAAAALSGFDRVDRWCQRQLTDGQAPEDSALTPEDRQ